MLTYAIEYCVILVLLFVTGYIVPAGLFHYLFFMRRSPAIEAMRIQKRRPSPQDIRREIRQSVSALLLFSVYCLIVYHAARNGSTALYFDFTEHPWWSAAAGFASMVVLHDIYFYTTLRCSKRSTPDTTDRSHRHPGQFYRSNHWNRFLSSASSPW